MHLPLLLLLLNLGLFVDLLDGLRALVSSPGHPVVLLERAVLDLRREFPITELRTTQLAYSQGAPMAQQYFVDGYSCNFFYSMLKFN